MSELETLQEGENLNTAQALDWLKSQGIRTSRQSLDKARKSGQLKWLRVCGRDRILYRREHLAAAFFKGVQSCPSASSDETARETITSGAVLPDQIFTQALAQATGQRQKRSGSGHKRSSCSVHHLGAKQP